MDTNLRDEYRKARREKAEKEGTCTLLALREGLITEPLSLEDMSFVSRMTEYLCSEKHNPIIHSWDDNWVFGELSAEKVMQTIVGRMKLCSFLLIEGRYTDKADIHLWCSDETLAAALTVPAKIGDRPVMTIAYTNTSHHHIDLVDAIILEYFDYRNVLKDGIELTGFESYPVHNLLSFLDKIGVHPLIDSNGLFKSDAPQAYPDLPGDEVLEATEEGMGLLQMIYKPF